MSSKRKHRKRKDGCLGQTAVSSAKEVFLTVGEMPPPARMPKGFNVDDFLFSKLFKSVNVEGRRTINEILRALFCQRMTEKTAACTIGQILDEEKPKKVKGIITRCSENLLKENPLNAEFDITCGISFLQEVFYKEFRTLSEHCQANICSLRELRNSLSHKYPLVFHDFEVHDEELLNLLKDNEEFCTLSNEIVDLEKRKNGSDASVETNEIPGLIDEKKKEKYVVTEIEKLRIILNSVLENASRVLEKDFTDCKSMVNKNLTDISRAKVQEYDQDRYDEEVNRFKDDPMHQLITKGSEELKNQYGRLKIANPCPWISMDEDEKLSINHFSIEKIYTPLRIEDSRKEVAIEDLLIARKESKGKTMVHPALVFFGLAGSGKTTLCLHILHHWTEGTNVLEILKDDCLVIYVELRTIGRCNTITSYLKEQRMKKSTLHISEMDLVQYLDCLKLLFIIDGYDEAKEQAKEVVRDIFAKFPNQGILVTTRTEFKEEVKLVASKYGRVKLLEICGFDESRIEKFTEKVFDTIKQSNYYRRAQGSGRREPKDFLRYIKGRGKILEKHLELPLTLALMIYMWFDCPTVLNSVTTCTSLYYELFKLCQKKINTRIGAKVPASDKTLEKLLILVAKKAWKLLANDEEVLQDEDEKEIDNECKEKRIPKVELLSAFLMYDHDGTSDGNRYDYSFMHRTQMEYLSAYYWAEEAEEKSLNEVIKPVSNLFGYHQVIVFLVGHLTRKELLDDKLEDVFKVINNAEVEVDDYNFWWRLLTESQIDEKPNENLAGEISREKLNKRKWKLSHETVVSGLELLIATPVLLKELTIEIESGINPYDISDFLDIMKSLKTKLWGRYGKTNPISTEIFFWHHVERRCGIPSNDFLSTLYPWGHLRAFAGSVGEYKQSFMLNYCHKMKNLRVRIETKGAQISLSNSLEKIGKNLNQLRVTLALDPKECDPDNLVCLTYDNFKGKLELTLPHMKDEDKKWIVEVVEKVSGRHGCYKLFLEKSDLSFTTVLYIMEMLRYVVHEKYTIESSSELTDKQCCELEIQQKRVHVDAVWL